MTRISSPSLFLVVVLILKFKIHDAFSPSLHTGTSISSTTSIINHHHYHHHRRRRIIITYNNIEEQHQEEEEISPRICYDPSRIRYRCRVAYDGTIYSGFQMQGGRPAEDQATVPFLSLIHI